MKDREQPSPSCTNSSKKEVRPGLSSFCRNRKQNEVEKRDWRAWLMYLIREGELHVTALCEPTASGHRRPGPGAAATIPALLRVAWSDRSLFRRATANTTSIGPARSTFIGDDPRFSTASRRTRGRNSGSGRTPLRATRESLAVIGNGSRTSHPGLSLFFFFSAKAPTYTRNGVCPE